MKTVLIFSYYFPPCNLTPSERVSSWAKYLYNEGVYPIIITRNWDIKINRIKDEFLSSGEEIKIEKYENYEVHYLPYKQSLKEKLHTEKNGLQRIIYLLLAIYTNLLNVFTFKFSPLNIFYNYAENLIQKNKHISALIVSAYPYAFFEYGYKLNKKYNLKWVADYRDDWTSNEILKKSIFHQFINFLNKKNEKKWVSTSSFYVSVTDHFVSKIKKVVGSVPGYCIANGYLKENYSQLKKDDFFIPYTISYVGSMYYNQPFELVIDSVKKFIDEQKNPNFQFLFIGLLAYHEAAERINKCIIGYEKYFTLTERLPKTEAIEMQNKSHYLFMCTHDNMIGAPGSKLYEYIALRKPVLIFPGDKDIIEETLKQTGQLVLCKTQEELNLFLKNSYNLYTQGKPFNLTILEQEIEKFDRKQQTIKFATLLKGL